MPENKKNNQFCRVSLLFHCPTLCRKFSTKTGQHAFKIKDGDDQTGQHVFKVMGVKSRKREVREH